MFKILLLQSYYMSNVTCRNPHDLSSCIYTSESVAFPQVKLRNAAKSRLNRWVKPHKRNPELDAPQWLITEWQKGNKAIVADLLSECNFDKDWVQFLLHLFQTNTGC